MALDFNVDDIIHRITVKFTPSYLPTAKKGFYAKSVLSDELDIHELASKAEVYNITTSPKIIEEGMTAGMNLIKYLTADGFRMKLPLITLSTRIPGEYTGTETHLAEGVHPEVRVRITPEFREYIKTKVNVVFDGIEDNVGFIGETVDEANGQAESYTAGDVLSLYGAGLKVDGDAAHPEVGAWVVDVSTANRIRAKRIIVNEPKTLKILVSRNLTGEKYVEIITQTTVSAHGVFLKETRTLRTDSLYGNTSASEGEEITA
ncbi:hypothetical protein Barb6XT_00216 [Bacteroidales bacterium Barb6XT]|nr:hypothetical protein Barb6XT_00216 [Bacteroidales bacterium Barb6XT]